MDLFYIPKVGDRVRSKKSILTGIVIKEGTMCVVKLDTPCVVKFDNEYKTIPNFKMPALCGVTFIDYEINTIDHTIFHYRRLSPTNKAFINHTAIRKAFSNLIKKLSF